MSTKINKFLLNDVSYEIMGADLKNTQDTDLPVSVKSAKEQFKQTDTQIGIFSFDEFVPNKSYEEKSIVRYNDRLFIFNQPYKGEWSDTYVQEVFLYELSTHIKPSKDYVYAITDSNDNVIAGITKDMKYVGVFDWISEDTQNHINQISDVETQISDIADTVEDQKNTFKKTLSKYSFAIVDSNDNVVFAIGNDGTLYDICGISETISHIPEVDSSISILSSRIDNIENNLDIESIKQIVCWGDSLTAAGHYEAEMSRLLGSEYNVVNLGVGGEGDELICARAGALSMFLKNDVVLPSDGSTVQIGTLSDSGIYYIDTIGTISNARLLLQGERNSVNPVYINDIECRLTWTGSRYDDNTGIYTLCRTTPVAGEDVVLKSGSDVLPAGVRNFRNPHAAILWIGTNKNWDSTSKETMKQTIVQEYRQLVDIVGTTNYLIIGLHHISTDYADTLENLMTSEFGAHYINWRKYLIQRGIDDAGLTPTEADLTAIENGQCPPSLMTDGVHHTTVAYQLLGRLIVNRMKQTGML